MLSKSRLLLEVPLALDSEMSLAIGFEVDSESSNRGEGFRKGACVVGLIADSGSPGDVIVTSGSVAGNLKFCWSVPGDALRVFFEPAGVARIDNGLLGLVGFGASAGIAGEYPILGDGCVLDCVGERGPTMVLDMISSQSLRGLTNRIGVTAFASSPWHNL